MRDLLATSWLVASLVATILASQCLASTSNAVRSSRPAAPAQVVTPIPGICDTANVADVFPDLTEPRTKREQIAFLQGRIVECTHQIDAALPRVPTPAPSPYWISGMAPLAASATPTPICTSATPATTSSDRIVLYAALGRCFAYLTYLNALPSPAPTESPLARVASRPTFYVFATGAADPTAASVLIRSVVDRLTKAQRKAARFEVSVVGRADWTATSNFSAQCQQDANTRGALVIETSIPETYRYNYLIIVANFTHVSASVEVLGCGAGDHDPSLSPLSLWNEQAITGKAHEDAWTLGTLAALLPFFALDKSSTTVTRGPETTTLTRTDSTAPALTGSLVSFYQAENLNLPAQNASVGLDVASDRFADSAMSRLGSLCDAPQIRELASDGNPANVPIPPPAHRTLLYKAAFEYVEDCSLFANFGR